MPAVVEPVVSRVLTVSKLRAEAVVPVITLAVALLLPAHQGVGVLSASQQPIWLAPLEARRATAAAVLVGQVRIGRRVLAAGERAVLAPAYQVQAFNKVEPVVRVWLVRSQAHPFFMAPVVVAVATRRVLAALVWVVTEVTLPAVWPLLEVQTPALAVAVAWAQADPPRQPGLRVARAS